MTTLTYSFCKQFFTFNFLHQTSTLFLLSNFSESQLRRSYIFSSIGEFLYINSYPEYLDLEIPKPAINTSQQCLNDIQLCSQTFVSYVGLKYKVLGRSKLTNVYFRIMYTSILISIGSSRFRIR